MDPIQRSIKLKDLNDTHKQLALRYLFAQYGYKKDTQEFLKKLKDSQYSDRDVQDFLRQLERLEKKS